MVTISMMSAKMATLDFLKIKVFRNKGYDVITSVYDVIKKIYHLTQILAKSLVTLGLLWEKLS